MPLSSEELLSLVQAATKQLPAESCRDMEELWRAFTRRMKGLIPDATWHLSNQKKKGIG